MLFWAWQTELLVAGLALALALEANRLMAARFDFSKKDFQRVADLCIWLMTAIIAYCIFTIGMPHAVVAIIKWAPLAMLPLVVAQSYSTSPVLDVASLFRLGEPTSDSSSSGPEIHSGYPYFVVCLLGAAAANLRSPWFYLGAVLLCAWLLWEVRPRRYSALSWGVSLALVVGLGFVGQVSLSNLQVAIVNTTMQWFSGSETDPYKSTTDIGQIGELKLSDRILVRLTSETPLPNPFLLHRASYDSYAAGAWLARDARLEAAPEDAPRTWTFQSSVVPSRQVTVSAKLKRGKGVLALPAGTVQIRDLAVEELKKNRMGTVRVQRRAPLIRYSAHYEPDSSPAGSPSERDLRLPKAESATLSRLGDALGLSEKRKRDIVSTIEAFFEQDFSYSLYQKRHDRAKTPLTQFLNETRSGHCEYFATATVLLLRAGGIPARYATGFSVQEFSKLENAYIVRQRHAHAWAQYYLDGAWHDLDTTPGIWASVEQEEASIFEPLSDLASWLVHQFNEWRMRPEGGSISPLWWLLVIAILGYVAWRLRLTRRRRIEREAAGLEDEPETWPGQDSEFYLIDARMKAAGLGRRTDELIPPWLTRLGQGDLDAPSIEALRNIVLLHNRYRFDPNTLTDIERTTLRETVERWLSTHAPDATAAR